MSSEDQKKRFARLNAAWLSGERVEGLKFLHNSTAEALLPDGQRKRGWVVAATVTGSEPTYTLEAQDGTGDIECPESALRSVEDQ